MVLKKHVSMSLIFFGIWYFLYCISSLSTDQCAGCWHNQNCICEAINCKVLIQEERILIVFKILQKIPLAEYTSVGRHLNSNPYGLFRATIYSMGGGYFQPSLKTALDSSDLNATGHSCIASNLSEHVVQFWYRCLSFWRQSYVMMLNSMKVRLPG